MVINCEVCKKEIGKKDRILAFDEVEFDDWDWNQAKESGGFEEVIPKSNQWYLAHYYCMFKKK